MGSRALRTLVSWPTVTSYFISRPTTRKKMAMRKSFTKVSKVNASVNEPMESSRGVSQNAAKAPLAGVLAIMTAAMAATSMTPAAMVDDSVNLIRCTRATTPLRACGVNTSGLTFFIYVFLPCL